MASVCPEPVPVRAAHMRPALSDAHSIPSSSIITIPSHFSEELFFSNDETFNPLSATVPGLCNLTPPARMAARAEQRMTFSQAFRLYPKAIIWSILLSSTIVMDGYDMSLLTSLFTLPIFQRSYGSAADDEESGFRISPVWEAALINGIQAGVVIGLIANGVVADRFGYRRTSISALLVLGALVFLAVFARNLQTLLAAQILCGVF
jgi:SP family general alpha glucoside:H+ symporter-like MFS transporter